MSPKKIIIEGVAGVKLSSDKGLDKWLTNHRVQCLVDGKGDTVVDFETLVDGDRYTLGPLQLLQQLPNGDVSDIRKQKFDNIVSFTFVKINDGGAGKPWSMEVQHSYDFLGEAKDFIA